MKKYYKLNNKSLKMEGFTSIIPSDVELVPASDRATYQSNLANEILSLLNSDTTKYVEFTTKFDDYMNNLLTAIELYIYMETTIGPDDTQKIILKSARVIDDVTKRKNLISILNPNQNAVNSNDYFKNFNIKKFFKSIFLKEHFVAGNMIFFLVVSIIILFIILIILSVMLNFSLKKCSL
tara:strand:+ start:1433 stop:1972 length:540 start_codon:yes stop_codon:yes gene_type:complete